MGEDGLLSHGRILKLHRAIVSARLATKRGALLTGLPPALTNAMPLAETAADQALSDLGALNSAGALAAGTVPLAIYLRNAMALLPGPCQEADVFNGALAQIPEPPSSTEPPPPPPSPPPPSPSTNYLRAWQLPALSLLVVSVVVGIVMATEKSWRLARDYGDYLQFLVILGVFIDVWGTNTQLPGSSDPLSNHCRECVKQFADHWKLLWSAWILFYAAHAVQHFVGYMIWGMGSPPWGWVAGTSCLLHFMAFLQGTLLLILSWTMLRPKLKSRAYRWKNYYIPAWIVSGLFAMAEGFLLLYRYTQGGPAAVQTAALWPALVAGLFAATCMGIFIGRLESAFLDVHPVELIALYMYASTQPVFRFTALAEFDKDLQERAWVVDLLLKTFALVLKLGLYFVVRRQLTGGRMAFYMWKQSALREAGPAEWERFRGDHGLD